MVVQTGLCQTCSETQDRFSQDMAQYSHYCKKYHNVPTLFESAKTIVYKKDADGLENSENPDQFFTACLRDLFPV